MSDEIEKGQNETDQALEQVVGGASTGKHIAKVSDELSGAALDEVAGGADGSGKVTMQDFHFVTKVDKASVK